LLFFFFSSLSFVLTQSSKNCDPLVAMLLFADERKLIKSFCFAMKDVYILSEKRGAISASQKIDSTLAAFPNTTVEATLHSKVQCLVLHEKQTQTFGHTEFDQKRQQQQIQQLQQQQQQQVTNLNLQKTPVQTPPLLTPSALQNVQMQYQIQHQQQQSQQLLNPVALFRPGFSPFNTASASSSPFSSGSSSSSSSNASTPLQLNTSPLNMHMLNAGGSSPNSQADNYYYQQQQHAPIYYNAFEIDSGFANLSNNTTLASCQHVDCNDNPLIYQQQQMQQQQQQQQQDHHHTSFTNEQLLDDFMNSILADNNDYSISNTMSDPNAATKAISQPSLFEMSILAMYERDKKLTAALPKSSSNNSYNKMDDESTSEAAAAAEETTPRGILNSALPKAAVGTITGNDIVSITIDANRQLKFAAQQQQNEKKASQEQAAATAASTSASNELITSHVGICGHITYSTVLFNKNKRKYFAYSSVEKITFCKNNNKNKNNNNERTEESAILNEGEKVTLNLQIKDNADVQLETLYYKSDYSASNAVDKTGYIVVTITLLAQVVQFNTVTKQAIVPKANAKPATKKLYYNVINSCNTRSALVEVPQKTQQPQIQPQAQQQLGNTSVPSSPTTSKLQQQLQALSLNLNQ